MKRKIFLYLIAAVLCVLLLLFAGTYAWNDYSQHKTNAMKDDGNSGKFDVRLVEEFEEPDHWKVTDDPVTKRVHVVNKASKDDGYGNVYVRIQLKEFMEIAETVYTPAVDDEDQKVRFAVGTDGHFIKFNDPSEAVGTPYEGYPCKYLTDAVTGDKGYFVQSGENQINGQYGKFLYTDISYGNAESLVTGVERSDSEVREAHQIIPNGECDYTPRTFLDDSDSQSLKFRQYVKWLFGDDVISLTEWLGSGGLQKKWVYDDRTDLGWIYWLEPLEPGQDTSMLIEEVELIVQPIGPFYYAIHVDMQALSLDELLGDNPEWSDAPPEIIDEFTKEKIVIINPPVTIDPGETDSPDGFERFPPMDGLVYVWTSSNTQVAVVDPETGEVTGVKDGSARIYITDSTGLSAFYVITVGRPTFEFVIDTTKGVSNPAFGNGNQNIVLQIGEHEGNNFNIDWGDSTPVVTGITDANLAASRAHTYASPGVYTIKISGALLGGIEFSVTSNNADYYGEIRLTELRTQLPREDSSSAAHKFRNCENLTYICEDMFKYNLQYVRLASAFRGCSKLYSISGNLLADLPFATDFSYIFSDCTTLTFIPVNTFEGNINVITFAGAFQNTPSLAGLPQNLFATCTKVTSFNSVFKGGGLDQIPPKLFEKNTNVIDFSSAFADNKKLWGEVPQFLFAECELVERFTNVFSGCPRLTTIPTNLFNNNRSVKSFSGAFANCTLLNGNVPQVWTTHSAAEYKGVYYGDTGVTGYSGFPETAIIAP